MKQQCKQTLGLHTQIRVRRVNVSSVLLSPALASSILMQ